MQEGFHKSIIRLLSLFWYELSGSIPDLRPPLAGGDHVQPRVKFNCNREKE
jgi:hypothetical protein